MSAGAATGDLPTAYRQSLLASYIDQLDDLAAGLESVPRDAWPQPLAPGEWSPHQVIWHVEAVEAQAYLPRLAQLIEGGHPTLKDFPGDEWMSAHYTTSESAASILHQTREAREQMRSRLAALPPAVWGHQGFHPYWGTRTLMWWVERSIAHVHEHTQQLTRQSGRVVAAP